DLDRPAELLDRPVAGHDLRNPGYHQPGYVHRLPESQADRFARPYGLEAVFGRLSFDPDQTDRGNVAEPIAHFERTRGDRNRQSRVTALHGHRDPLVRIEEDGALYLAIALHFLAIDRNYAVARS